MTKGKGPYSRVYLSIADDPMFERVFDNDRALSTWLRMLLVADAMYPVSAQMTSRNPTVRLLIDCGLVIEKPGKRYSIRGLEAERERRSEIGRNAAAVRYQSERTANAMPRRDETSIDKTSNGNGIANGNAMGWRTRPSQPTYQPAPGEAARVVHDGKHRDADKCGVCHPLPREVEA